MLVTDAQGDGDRRYAESVVRQGAGSAHAAPWVRRLRRTNEWIASLFAMWWVLFVVGLILRGLGVRVPAAVGSVVWIAASAMVARAMRRGRP